ncbi:alpha/beta hydrolase [Aliiroseovarius sp. S2029]|uniref:alpha/beta hydrolase n=1 Tax=Aliiroseovarius sp. S2029 TaxID=2936988 RepID=UPI0020C17AAD|nr:alpha/beta hydrolase [Aliiroseovarius sp. S2029]MCK8482841.1 alpha/beta hydrolase [Aliiroseovarius sp. S2029]
MKKFPFLVLLMVAMSCATVVPAPAPAQANSVQSALERKVFYQFNPQKADPKNAHPKLSAKRYKGAVIWVTPPEAGKPTIYYLPGSGGNLGTRKRKFPWFVNQGYGLVALAYPGMSGSKGLPSRKTIQNLANSLYRDLPEYVGNGPVIIMGESLGTGVALQIADSKIGRQRPPLGLILQAPYTSLNDLVAAKQPAMVPLFAARNDLWPSKRIIKRVTVPIFIMHGGSDKTVPVSMGRTLFKMSPSPNKLFVTQKAAGHTTIWSTKSLNKMKKWIAALQ